MRYDPIMCMMVDDSVKAHDADPIAALINFKKTAEYGDSIKIDIGKGKTAIVQKEANGWYATIGNEKVKGTFNIIAGYLKSASAKDSASAIDKAIKTADGMFSSSFGEYSKGAKFKKDKFLKELAGISNVEEFAKRMTTLDNELRKNLERLDEAYNVASKDYYAARNEIRSIMSAFSSEAFGLFKKLDKK